MENKKYELLTDNTIIFNGVILYRIRALRDFSDVKKGELGGYIEKEGNLSHNGDCWIYGNANVFGNARVYGNAIVRDDAIVSGNARVSDNAIVHGNARVRGNASVSGNAYISSDDDYIVICNIGSRHDNTTFYKCEDGLIRVNCGCFNGTLDEFVSKVKETHGDNKYAKEYLSIIMTVSVHFDIDFMEIIKNPNMKNEFYISFGSRNGNTGSSQPIFPSILNDYMTQFEYEAGTWVHKENKNIWFTDGKWSESFKLWMEENGIIKPAAEKIIGRYGSKGVVDDIIHTSILGKYQRSRSVTDDTDPDIMTRNEYLQRLRIFDTTPLIFRKQQKAHIVLASTYLHCIQKDNELHVEHISLPITCNIDTTFISDDIDISFKLVYRLVSNIVNSVGGANGVEQCKQDLQEIIDSDNKVLELIRKEFLEFILKQY